MVQSDDPGQDCLSFELPVANGCSERRQVEKKTDWTIVSGLSKKRDKHENNGGRMKKTDNGRG